MAGAASGERVGYRYPLWADATPTARCPHPWKDATDYTITFLDVVLPSDLTAATAVRTLNQVDPDWRNAMWALVGLKDIDAADTIVYNLASVTVEPLWLGWDRTATGYTQQVFDFPRQAMMMRVLDLVRTHREGVPSPFEDYDVHAHVVDVIEAGGMDFRIYDFAEDPTVAAFFAQFDSAWASMESATDAIQTWLEELGSTLESLFLDGLAAVVAFNDWMAEWMVDIQAAFAGEGEISDLDTLQAKTALVLAEIGEDEALSQALEGDLWADMTYNIERPMQYGGAVSWCCVLGRKICSDGIGATPCWPMNPPLGYLGCGCTREEFGTC